MTEVICFHNPDEVNGYLSNWYPSHFVMNGIEFSSMEQYMMHRKACCFNDAETAARILETDDVAEIKRLGRLVTGYDDHVWNGVPAPRCWRNAPSKTASGASACRCMTQTGSIRGNGAVGTCSDTL